MSPRHPTSSLYTSSFRRRSGVYPPSDDSHPRLRASPFFPPGLPDHEDGVTAQRTVNLVPQTYCPLGFERSSLPDRGISSSVESPHLEYIDHDQQHFSAIPLTPDSRSSSHHSRQSHSSTHAISRADSTRTDITSHSNRTHESRGSRLPTPEFGGADGQTKVSQLRSFLTRGVSFNSFRGAPIVSFPKDASLPTRARDSRLPSARTVVDENESHHHSSARSVRSTGGKSVRSLGGQSFVSFAPSTTSIDSGHASLISSIGTTNKFTHKWPRPRSIAATGGGINVALEDGQGLGMDRIERWTTHKWCILFSIFTVFAYGAAWEHADTMYVADNDILILITLSGSILLFTALMGMTGTLLNSRPILAVYTLLLWPAFVSILAIGYASYKRSTFSLDHKLNLAWSQWYTPLGRLFIQDSLRCCGYYNALHESTPSKHCYPRTTLPGCKGKLYRFEKANLELMWAAAFGVVPLHIANMVIALLCANHVTVSFGKGLTPKGYRLRGVDVRTDAEKLMKGLALPAMSRASSTVLFREDRKSRD